MANKKRNLEIEPPVFVQFMGVSKPWNDEWSPLFTQCGGVEGNHEFASMSTCEESSLKLNEAENDIVDVPSSQILEGNNTDWQEDGIYDYTNDKVVADEDFDDDDSDDAEAVIAINDGIMEAKKSYK